jgi:hypothetical protein
MDQVAPPPLRVLRVGHSPVHRQRRAGLLQPATGAGPDKAVAETGHQRAGGDRRAEPVRAIYRLLQPR